MSRPASPPAMLGPGRVIRYDLREPERADGLLHVAVKVRDCNYPRVGLEAQLGAGVQLRAELIKEGKDGGRRTYTATDAMTRSRAGR
mmetsp:Transcript_32757/g.58691  ORF Transcript_32757/g.58691 Transcript_32757/m.58691 type:complete len:87 (+) Transcript_32757:522-782(+)